ncbi:MAG: 50S ribosomal protein L10 [Gemmatimonadetes bacterium]|jgi:large subunit ribosomal protein L10|nr:50S ribosomal protein L10 [Gemmatimonadota bacterium]
MNREQKSAFSGDLQEKLADARAFYLTDFTGMSVKQMTNFRARLRKEGVEYLVVKNTLAIRALDGLELPDIAGFFSGPTGLVIGREDAVTAAKVLTDFAREFDNRPAIKVGVVERKEVAPDQIKRLAELPPKEVLLAQLAGGLQAPMARIAGGMSQILAGFARAMDALRQQREGAAS